MHNIANFMQIYMFYARIMYLYEYTLTDTDDGKGIYREVSESEYGESIGVGE